MARNLSLGNAECTQGALHTEQAIARSATRIKVSVETQDLAALGAETQIA